MNAQDLISVIRNDKSSGASELTVSAVGCMLGASEGLAATDPKMYLDGMVDIGKQLIDSQPSMAPLFISVNTILLALEKKFEEKATVDELKRIARETSKEFIVNSKKAVTMIKEQMADLIENGNTILTHSYSSTVIESLSFANSQGRKIKVYVTESRPLFEGRNTANILSTNGINTLLIADMASFHFLDEVDMILAGCDCICEEGVVNKIGTKGLAITASQLGIPFFIVGEKSKFLPKKYKSAPRLEEKEPEEIFNEGGGFKVKNIYFDMTPYKFIKGIITEEGILDHEEVMAILDKEKVASRLLYD